MQAFFVGVASLDDLCNPITDMRYAPNHKAETHQRIVKDASRHLRRAGLSGSGVARVMRASGLTHGGFYKHFRNKNDLLVEALTEAFRQLGDHMKRIAEAAPPGEGWKAIVNWYLSEEHCSHPETGCPMAALGPELKRIDSKARKRITEVLWAHRNGLIPLMPGREPGDRERAFSIMFPAMLGALQVARLIPDPDKRKQLLMNMCEFLLANFG